MLNTVKPQIQQTLPGRSREYRLYSVDYCDFGDFSASMVVLPGWGTSYSHTYGQPGVVLNAYRVPFQNEYHSLNGTWFETQEDAQRAAFEAGLLAYMVYEN